MQTFETLALAVDGTEARVLRNRAASQATVFVDGAAPGITPYGSGAHVWGGVLQRFAADGPVAVVDSLTAFADGNAAAGLDVDGVRGRLLAVLRALGLARCHLVVHDTAGLSALLLACEAPGLVAGVTLVSCVSASPTRDGEENITLRYPYPDSKAPHAQRWVLERLSYSHHHVDAALVDACVGAAASPAWRAAEADAGRLARWNSSILRGRARVYAASRNDGVPVPVQVVWGTHDPLGSTEHGLWLYRILAQGQPTAQFDLLNRAGALPFRDEPEGFHQAVAAFADLTLREGAPA